jgi:hypothetical protein
MWEVLGAKIQHRHTLAILNIVKLVACQTNSPQYRSPEGTTCITRLFFDMTDHSDFVAQGLVRSYSDSLRAQQRENGAEEPQASRRRLENAFCEEVEKEDALATLLQEAMSR